MANVFLNADETGVNIANDGDLVFGQQGDESVIIQAGVTGVVLDQNIEGVTLDGNKADYTFEQAGNQLLVKLGGVLVATVPVQVDADGTELTFDDGTFYAQFNEGVIEVGDDPVDPGGDEVTFTLTAAADSHMEGNPNAYTVTASQAVAADTDVTFSVIPGDSTAVNQGTSTTNLNDFAAGTFTPTVVTIAAGQTTATFSVSGATDGITELPESYSVQAVVGSETLSKDVTLLDGAGTYTLTTAVDNIDGTTGNDTIQGLLDGTDDTLSIGDVIDGNAGTDTLRVVTADNAVDTGIATITNVETLKVVNGAAALATIDADSDGYTSLSLDKSNAALTISGVGTSTAVSIADAGAALNTITYDAVTGTADSATVTVGKAATGAGISMLGIETANVVLTGKAVLDTANAFTNATAINITNADTSTLDLSAATGTKAAVTVNGAGVLTLGTLNASIATVDASASAGGITTTLDAAQTSAKGGSGVDSITVAVPTTAINVSTGAGNDTVDVSALALTTAGTLDGTNEVIAGGDGDDTLVTDEADLTVANVKTNISKASSFEKLMATSAVTAFAADGFTAINDFVFSADNTAGPAARTYTLESSDSLTLTNNNSAAAMTLNPVLDSGTDELDLILAASTADLTQFGITASQIETINIASTDTNATAANTNTITTLTVQNNTKINLTGAADLTLTTATGTELTIDGSAATGKLGITVVGGNDTITGGSAVDTIDGAAGVDTISGMGGADIITGGLGADNLTGGAAADIFIVGVGDAVIDAAGVGADKIADFNTGGSDVIRLAAADNVAAADVVAPTAGATGSIATGGKLTFATADDTMTEQITVAIAETGANELVFWENGGNTYVYASGAAGDGSNDQMIQLTGVTGLTTITESTTTAGDFTIA